MVQIIKYKCCGKVFAACSAPECYTDKQWLKDLKKYVSRGEIVEMQEDNNIRFGKCSCIDKDISNQPKIKQLDLFSLAN